MNADSISITDAVREAAAADPEFRRQLLADPHKALGDRFQATIPPGMNVRVVEEDPSTLVLVLPPSDDERELTDAELAQAAGGGCSGIFSKPLCWSTKPLCWNTKQI